MKSIDRRAQLVSRPRAIIVGSYRDPFKLSTDELTAAIAADSDVTHIPANAPIRQGLRVFKDASRAIREDGYELVHLLDPRFAPVGAMLRRRYDVPVSVSFSSADDAGRSPAARLTLRGLNQLDHGFTSEEAVAATLRDRAPRLPVSLIKPGASALPWPSKHGLAAIGRALRGVRPGRLVIALPWPDNRNDLRWFRDVVAPQLDAKPLCLLIGAPSRRQAHLLLGGMGMKSDFRVHSGRLSADVIAAAARCIDAFVVCGNEPQPGAPDGQLAIALSTGGVPVVTNAAEDARVLAHERNAFVVDPGDERGYVHTLNQILALPAVQRHVLGEEFARFTLGRWPWRDVAAAYTERFAALVGRPQIPAEFRAAA
jgi:hypothetical protein